MAASHEVSINPYDLQYSSSDSESENPTVKKEVRSPCVKSSDLVWDAVQGPSSLGLPDTSIKMKQSPTGSDSESSRDNLAQTAQGFCQSDIPSFSNWVTEGSVAVEMPDFHFQIKEENLSGEEAVHESGDICNDGATPDESDTNATEDTPLNAGSTEMESSGSEESDCPPESKRRREYLSPFKGQRRSETTVGKPSKVEENIARSGKTVRVKQMGPGCKENCRYKCHSRITYEERLGVYTGFYRTAPTLGQQWEYIRQTVNKAPKKESTREESRRANSYTYSFFVKKEARKVCKTMYLSTLQISNTVVETAFHKRGENGTLSPSERDEVPNSLKGIPRDLKDSVVSENLKTCPSVTPKRYVSWWLKKQAVASLPTDDSRLSADRESGQRVSSGNSSASGSDVQSTSPLGYPALIIDMADDTPLNVVSAEMELSESEESSSPQEPGSLGKISRKRQRAYGQSEADRGLKPEENGSRGKPVRVREMGPGCKENCRYNCHSRVTHEERLEIYTDFYRTAVTLEQQWEYICRTVKKTPKKASTRDESRRANSYSYSFRIKEADRRVCKTMYLSTLQVSNSIVETAFQKRRENGTISPCKRGKVPLPITSSRRIPQDLKDSVREHINTFPRVLYHCCGKTTIQEFLQEGMSVAKMHRMYVLWMLKRRAEVSLSTNSLPVSGLGNTTSEDKTSESDIQSQFRLVEPSRIDGKIIATERQYRDIFDTEFELTFISPKRKECDDCVAHMRTTSEGNR